MRKIYLDNNATTPVHAAVLDAMLPFFREDFGNPSSAHWAGEQCKKSREQGQGAGCVTRQLFSVGGDLYLGRKRIGEHGDKGNRGFTAERRFPPYQHHG